MNLNPLHTNSHLHVWARTIDGAEFINTIFENEVDASLAFIGIVKNVTKYTIAPEALKIEDVMGSLKEDNGMYAGVPGLVVVLSRCKGGCHSATWN